MRIMDLAYSTPLDLQMIFADELVREFEFLVSAYGENVALGRDDVERVYDRLEKATPPEVALSK